MVPGDFNNDGVTDLFAITRADSGTGSVVTQSATSATTIARFDLTTRQGALGALSLAEAISLRISKELGIIGAGQSRIESAIGTLSAQRENTYAAAGRIQDADIAFESGAAVRLQILQQAGQAVLAQANQLPRIGLQLLAGV